MRKSPAATLPTIFKLPCAKAGQLFYLRTGAERYKAFHSAFVCVAVSGAKYFRHAEGDEAPHGRQPTVKKVCRRDHHGNAEVSLFHQDNAPRDKYDAEYIDKLRAECFDPPNKK